MPKTVSTNQLQQQRQQEEIDAVMSTTVREVTEMFNRTKEQVILDKQKGTDTCLQSTREAKELFADFADVKVKSLQDTWLSYQHSREALVRLDAAMDTIAKQAKTIYSAANIEAFTNEIDASLQNKLSTL